MISLRVPERELHSFKAYAKHNNSSLSEIIRLTMLEEFWLTYKATSLYSSSLR
ncbi:MAG: DUF6290 family protein [Schwartzia sp. (in: firmicutes)]